MTIFLVIFAVPAFAGSLEKYIAETKQSVRVESIEELTKIAASSKIDSIVPFLRALPAGSYPNFTFITNSRSLQRGNEDNAVSDLWPRVLRTSRDGKISLSFVCDPRSPAYNKIEVIFFDDLSQTFRTMTYDLNHRTQIADQKVCLSCHSLSMKPETFQPIWPEHKNWRDCDERRGISLYGGISDSIGPVVTNDRRETVSSPKKIPFGCGLAEDQQMEQREAEAYKNFRRVQKDNPCYALLPWPEDASNLPSYPYLDSTEGSGPNTRITVAYSQLLARKNARVIRGAMNYKEIEPYLRLESFGCLKTSDYVILSKLLGKSDWPETIQKSLNPETGAPVLFRFATIAGLRNRDWNLVQNANEPSYRTGTVPLSKLITTELFGSKTQTCDEIRREGP